MKFLGTNELQGIDSAFPNKSRGQVVSKFGGHPIPQGRMRKGRGICDIVGMAAIKKAMPDADEEKIYWCYHNLSGALTLTLAQTGRIDRLSNNKCHSSDFHTAYGIMIPFVAAGFKEACKG